MSVVIMLDRQCRVLCRKYFDNIEVVGGGDVSGQGMQEHGLGSIVRKSNLLIGEVWYTLIR